MMHYHGTPITPLAQLFQLAGRNLCVSYARPEQCRYAHQIGQSVMLDNGAFSVWRRGVEVDWSKWCEWASPWLDCPTTWAVLPDVIDGDAAANDELLKRFAFLPRQQVAPVWHLHEPLSRLANLCAMYPRVCFGSSGAYARVGTTAWHGRIAEAFDRIADDDGRVPWVHMLRGMSQSGGRYPFASVDSTDVARNHNRVNGASGEMAARWDSLQAPSHWKRPTTQLQIAHGPLRLADDRAV